MKQISSYKIVLVVVFFVFIGVVLGVTEYLLKNNSSRNTEIQPAIKPEPVLSNRNQENSYKSSEFKFGEVKVGDKVADMAIKFIKPFSDDVLTSTKDNVSIGFSGEITISGKYHYYGNDPSGFLSDAVCFDSLDEQSQVKIPKMIGDERSIWFCFGNQELAKSSFSPRGSSGTATIAINDYTINILPAEVTNIAKLIKVISKN